MQTRKDTFIHILKGNRFILYPEKIVYWMDEDMIICADLHLGKINHFRSAGIPLPEKAEKEGLVRLTTIIREIGPKKVLILGDLFHSSYNLDWLTFREVIEKFPETSFILVGGNHDILDAKEYHGSRLIYIEDQLEAGPFIFTHEPLEQVIDEKYNICGHLHPAVRLRGKARQRIKIPCFYFGDHTGILPAFGTFTGTAVIHPMDGEKIFLIAGGKVLPV